jgi:hypothetical protein
MGCIRLAQITQAVVTSAFLRVSRPEAPARWAFRFVANENTFFRP